MASSQKQRSYIVIAVVVLLTAFSVHYISKLKFNYDFEAFFPNEDKELIVYEHFRKTFEHDNEFVLLGIENKKGIFKKDFLEKIDRLTAELKQIQYIERVISPTTLKQLNFAGLAPIEVNLLHVADSSLYPADSINIYSSPELIGSFFPTDAKSVCLFLKTADNLSKVKSDSLARRIERAFTKYRFDEVHYVGRIVAQDVYLKNLQKEFTIFLLISFAVVVLFLFFTFRSPYGIIVPVIIVLLSIVWTLGVMGAIGKPIDIMTVMLPTMIFIAGMSDVVHFFSKYFDELHKQTPKEQIFRLILKEVGFPTFLTLVTTIVGFLSLLFSSIQPIRDFGIYTSIGITIAFILSYTLLPAIMFLYTPHRLAKKQTEENRTNNAMRKLFFWIFRHQKGILFVTAIVLTASVWGITKIRVNNILLEDLSDKVRIKQDFNYFDKHYSGVRPFELLIEVKDSSKRVWDYEVIKEIDKLDVFLEKNYKMGFMLTPAGVAKNINKALNGNDPDYYKLPATKEEYEEIRDYIQKNKKNRDLKRIIAVDGKSCRITGKIEDMGSMKINLLNEKLSAFTAASIDKGLIGYTITGAATLMDRNNEYMVENMVQGFAWSIGIIALLTFFLHRSWRMVLVFILPNFIPMVIIAGFMGFAGIELKAATSLVFSIAFGIATDDTIHFISRLKIELGYGKSLLYAFKRTYFETGKPIILTTFILVGGFMSLMTSDFESTFYFGFLICITIIVALIAELFLLPILLMMILGGKKKNAAVTQNKR
ncbi:MAG: rane protein [Bacteroidetes bacterium]|jgi:predicted RND superfamily exporter protein|nr:rane protein [Bacteroidota bacterium]